MPVTITPDRIRLTDASGTVKFDTDEGLFTCTDFRSGTFALSQAQSIATSFTRSNVDATTTHTLESGINANATHILGLFRSNWSISSSWGGVAQRVGGTNWRSANATAMDMVVKHSSSHRASANAAEPAYWQGFSLYTFFLDGTQIKCKERIMLQSYVAASGSTEYTLTKNAGSIDYRLYCGLFV